RETRPAWALVIERMEWGRFYGFPEAFAHINPIPQRDPGGGRRALEEIRREAAGQLEAMRARGERNAGYVVSRGTQGRPEETVIKPADLREDETIIGVARLAVGPEEAWAA
ncbi:MAG: hypothetical protein GWO24_08560, partial [Akkermansiaceae bacterium]|nr:hypothetical protein [Akkermansiaceae bacterium]